MTSKPIAAASSRQSTSVDSRTDELSTRVDSANETLRLAVVECKWTLEALSEETGIDKSLISRVLNGERPLTQKFIDAMPDDVEANYEKRRCQARGFIVIERVDEQTAHHQLACGLFNLLTSRLPAKTSGQIKASLPITRKVGVA